MKRVLVVSDMHCGAMSGLLPPAYYNRDRDVRLNQNHVQEYLWDGWTSMCNTVGHVDMVICNGDIIDGCNRHSHGKDILIPDVIVQCDIACQALRMINADKYVFTQGSGYHVSDNPSADEMICRMMNGEWYGWFGDIYIDNIIINVQHDTTFTEDPCNQYNSQQKKVSMMRLEGDESDIYVRSHIHRFTYSGNANSMTVTTPCWKGLDGFTSKKSQIRPDNGYVFFDIEGSNYSWDHYVFKIPKYFFTKHNNY